MSASSGNTNTPPVLWTPSWKSIRGIRKYSSWPKDDQFYKTAIIRVWGVKGVSRACPCNSVWLSNGLDSNAKLRNKKARWSFFFFLFHFKISANGGGQSRKGSWVGDMTSLLMRWVFSLQWKMREWLLCSGWRRKVITLGARGGKQLSPDKVMTREDSN